MTSFPRAFALAILFLLVTGNLATAQDGVDPERAQRNWQIIVRDRVLQRARQFMGANGTVVMGFTVHQDGSVDDIRPYRSSDPAAAELGARIVRDAYPFPPIPALVDRQSVRFSIRIAFHGAGFRRR